MRNLKESLKKRPFSLDTFSLFFATGAFIGYVPPFPGTLGSLQGIILYYLTLKYGLSLKIPLLTLLFLLGVYTSQRVSRLSQKEDPDEVVIDEICGAYLSALGKGTLTELLLSFIIFRIIDIGKPYPLRRLEKVGGGLGIMLDDVAAGLLTNLFVSLLILFFGVLR